MAGPGPGRMGPMHFLTEEEKQNMPKVTKELLARIMSYLKPYWLQFIFVFIAILLSATVGLFPSIITGMIWAAIICCIPATRTLPQATISLSVRILSASHVTTTQSMK